MDTTELIKIHNINKGQVLLDLISNLESIRKNVKKGIKKSTQNLFILKYIIESLKISNFYYLKVLA